MILVWMILVWMILVVDDSGWDEKSLDDPMNKDILLTSFAMASDDDTASTCCCNR